MTLAKVIGMVLVIMFCLSSAREVNELLEATGTHIYFLIGPDAHKAAAVDNFISRMGFLPHHYEKVVSFDRNLIAKNQGRVLRYLTFSRKMITREWIRRYITKVDDPASRIKNIGRLALAMTLDKVLQRFIESTYENCLVFEDDAIMNPDSSINALQTFSDMLSLPVAMWHIQYLGFCFECGGRKNYEATAPSRLYADVVFPLCTHAILFNRAAVLVIMNTYKPFRNNKGDWLLHITACEHNLKVIRPHNPIFIQNVTAATVGGSQLGNYNDKSPFAPWVNCHKERVICDHLRSNYSQQHPGYDVKTSPLSQSLTYTPGIPQNYIL